MANSTLEIREYPDPKVGFLGIWNVNQGEWVVGDTGLHLTRDTLESAQHLLWALQRKGYDKTH